MLHCYTDAAAAASTWREVSDEMSIKVDQADIRHLSTYSDVTAHEHTNTIALN